MKLKKKLVAIFLVMAVAVLSCIPAFAADKSTRGVAFNQQSGYYMNHFDINLTSGGDNGSAVFRLYTSKPTDEVAVRVYHNGFVVAYAELTANNGAEQTVYFNAGKKASAGVYTVEYQSYDSALNPIQCWICSW